jgi:hypothetical protein
MKRTTTILLLLLISGIVRAQERVDPRHPDAQPFPEFGRMIGLIDTSKGQVGDAERFGYRISPVGDVNQDGLADWIVAHYRVDSIQLFDGVHIIPKELLLYKGVRRRVPAVESGVRIGPIELFCETSFLAAGDFDADSHPDIVIQAQFWGDSSFNNLDGYPLSYVIVYWGNDSGSYSNADTSRLASFANTWLGGGTGIAGDVTGDHLDDLVLYFSGGQAMGWRESVKAPRLHLFAGQIGKRWGRSSVSNAADLRWWSSRYNPADEFDLSVIDHDRDGANDLVLIEQVSIGDIRAATRISILYGRSGRPMLDTLDIEQIIMSKALGKVSRFIDVTGDSVAELVVNCGVDSNKYRIYAGRKGQRLMAQYGSDMDQPIAGQGWWSRPWLEILLPHALHDGWYPNFRFAVEDLGDGNLDRIRDIWTYSEPYLICYTTGEYLDQWIDGYVYLGTMWAVANIGDIDGSGQQTIALHYDEIPRQPFTPFPGGIVYIKPNRNLPTTYADPPLKLPHLPPDSTGDVIGTDDRNHVVGLTLQREAGTRRYTFSLTNGIPGVQYPVLVVNLLGERISLHHLTVNQSSVRIDLPQGLYFISMMTSTGSRTAPVVVE